MSFDAPRLDKKILGVSNSLMLYMIYIENCGSAAIHLKNTRELSDINVC